MWQRGRLRKISRKSVCFSITATHALLPGDSTTRRADFAHERPPTHLPCPTVSPAHAFRCTISLDTQKQPPYTFCHPKHCLIKEVCSDFGGLSRAWPFERTAKLGVENGRSRRMKTIGRYGQIGANMKFPASFGEGAHAAFFDAHTRSRCKKQFPVSDALSLRFSLPTVSTAEAVAVAT